MPENIKQHAKNDSSNHFSCLGGKKWTCITFSKKKKFGTNYGTRPYGLSRKINYNFFIFENNFSIKKGKGSKNYGNSTSKVQKPVSIFIFTYITYRYIICMIYI